MGIGKGHRAGISIVIDARAGIGIGMGVGIGIGIGIGALAGIDIDIGIGLRSQPFSQPRSDALSQLLNRVQLPLTQTVSRSLSRDCHSI